MELRRGCRSRRRATESALEQNRTMGTYAHLPHLRQLRASSDRLSLIGAKQHRDLTGG